MTYSYTISSILLSLVEETDPDELPRFKNTDNDQRRRLDISFY